MENWCLVNKKTFRFLSKKVHFSVYSGRLIKIRHLLGVELISCVALLSHEDFFLISFNRCRQPQGIFNIFMFFWMRNVKNRCVHCRPKNCFLFFGWIDSRIIRFLNWLKLIKKLTLCKRELSHVYLRQHESIELLWKKKKIRVFVDSFIYPSTKRKKSF